MPWLGSKPRVAADDEASPSRYRTPDGQTADFFGETAACKDGRYDRGPEQVSIVSKAK